MKTTDVVCIGAALLDISLFQIEQNGFFEREPNIVNSISFSAGGDAANQSIVLTRLGHRVKFMTRLGADDIGAVLCKKLQDAGVDMSCAVRDPEAVSIANNILIGEDDARVYITNISAPGSSIANFSERDIDYSALKDAKVVSLGSFFVHPLLDGDVMKRIFQTVKESGGITCADVKADDPGCRIENYGPALPHLDYLFANEKEAKNLTGLDTPEEMADYFLRLGVATVTIKLGGRGCFVKSKDGTSFYDTPFYVDPVDTTGAGDNFLAGFISGLVRELPLMECVQFAKATSGICVGSLGASTGVRSMEQVQSFLERRRADARSIL